MVEQREPTMSGRGTDSSVLQCRRVICFPTYVFYEELEKNEHTDFQHKDKFNHILPQFDHTHSVHILNYYTLCTP